MRKKTIVFFIITMSLLFFSTNADAGEYDDFSVARQAFKDGFYDIAKVKLIKFLNDYPNSERKAQALLLLGQCYHRTGKSHKAVNYLQKALNANGAKMIKDVIYFWLGELELEAHQYSSARKYFNKIIQNYSQSEYAFKAHDSIAISYYREEKYKKSLRTYKEMKKIYKDKLDESKLLFKESLCWFKLKEYTECRKIMNKYLKSNKHPRKIRGKAFYYLGECCYHLDDYKEAISFYEKCLEITEEEEMKLLAYHGLGWSNLKSSKYQSAINYFQNVYDSKEFQYYASVLYGLGKSYYKEGKHKKALTYFKKLIKEHKNSKWRIEGYIEIIDIYFDLQRYEKALSIVKKALSIFNSTSTKNKFLYKKGWINIRLSEFSNAITCFENIMNTGEGMLKIRSICRLGDIYFDKKEYNKAIEYYDIILSQYPESPYAYYAQYWLGKCFYNLRNYQGATLAFQTFVKNYPDNYLVPKVKFYLAQSLFYDGKYMKAKEYFDELVHKSKSQRLLEKSHLQLGNSFYNGGFYKKAIGVYKNITSTEYSSDMKQMAEYQKGWSYYNLGENKKAINVFKQFLKKYPNSNYAPDIKFWFGDFYYSRGEFKSAIESYKEFIKNYPTHELVPNARYWIAWSYFKLDNFSESLLNFQKVVQKSNNPSFIADSKIRVGKIYAQRGKYQKAIELLKEVVSRFKDSYFKYLGYRTLGDVYRQKENYESAINSYKNALRDNKKFENWNGYLQFHIALSYKKNNNFDKSISEYLKVGYLYPESTFWKMQGKLRAADLLEKQKKWKKALKLYKDLVKEKSDASKIAAKRIKWINNNTSINTKKQKR